MIAIKQLKNADLLLKLLEENKLKTTTVFEHFVNYSANLDKKLSLRIDVDNCLVCAEKMAIELEKLGIKASFYFLTLTAPYNIFNDCLKNIHSMGHEVGLHSDHFYLQKRFGFDAIKLIKQDIEIMNRLIGDSIKGMCFHGNGKYEFQHNWKLYRNLSPESLGLIYHDGFTSTYCNLNSKNMWLPPVENYLSDDPTGWLDSDKHLLNFFKRVSKGHSSHLIIHPQYFFKPASWVQNNYCEKVIPLPKIKKNHLAIVNKGIKLILDQLFLANEFIIRQLLFVLMYLLGKKSNHGILNEFSKTDFITQSSTQPNNYEKIVGLLKIDKNDHCLDIGFGAGPFLFLMAQTSCQVYGVEPADDLFNYVQQKITAENITNIKISKNAGEELPFDMDYFDKAMCMSVLMMTNPYNVLKEINRVMKQGGILLMHVSDIGYSLHSLRDGLFCKEPNRIKNTLKELIKKFRRSILRQYNIGGVFTYNDLKILARLTGFEVIKDINQGYYDWEPSSYCGFTTQHLITFRKK